jgi:ABC-type taurine transport system ATPase subunit
MQDKSIRVSNYVSGQQEYLLPWLNVNKNHAFTGAVNELSEEE